MRLIILGALLGLAACGASSTPSTTLPDGGPAPTYWKDIKPITQAHCEGCHVAGGIGPFALDTYGPARAMATAMKGATATRYMPPWKPSADCGGPFRDERKLTVEQITTIGDWADHGALEGNTADAPAAAAPIAGLPRVDATMMMTEPYTPQATDHDDYRCFIIDPALVSPKQVTGYDIQPGARAIVHHVILYIADKAKAEAADAKSAGSGWECFGGPNVDTDGAIGAWAPGTPAVTYPGGTGISIGAGKVLAMQIHYNTTAGTAPDQTTVKLQYAEFAVTNASLLALANDEFAIPPNSRGYTSSMSFKNPIGLPIKVWGFLPHMHTKGTQIRITGPSDRCLIDIPQWDFHWQQQYFRPTAFTLGENDSVDLKCTWNNPSAKQISWGENTSDEMCFAYVYATL